MTASTATELLAPIKQYIIQQNQRPVVYNTWKQHWLRYMTEPNEQTLKIYTQRCIESDNAFNDIHNNVQLIKDQLMKLHSAMNDSIDKHAVNDVMIENVIGLIESIERLEEAHLDQYTQLQSIQHQYTIQLKQPFSMELSHANEQYRSKMNTITEQIGEHMSELRDIIDVGE